MDHVKEENLRGFRLKRFEVYNWGTFNRKVWSLKLNGKTGLLTGDNGAGKSTLVDALVTLLVPPNKIVYNVAAGAKADERNRKSYILGYFKSSSNGAVDDVSHGSLRDRNSYSVILGVFEDKSLKENGIVTLAQVMWLPNDTDPPSRFYVCAEHDLSIAEDFSNFGKDMKGLKAKLKKRGCRLFDKFVNGYGSFYMQKFGIAHEQAVDLFNQTVSMKSVDNINKFVSTHMLEPFDATSRIEALIDHFNDLNIAYERVVAARNQILMLKPIVSCAHDLQELKVKHDENFLCLKEHETFIGKKKIELLRPLVENARLEIKSLDDRINSVQRVLIQKKQDLQRIRDDISRNGGNRISELECALIRVGNEKIAKERRYNDYLRQVELVGGKEIFSYDEFLAQNSAIKAKLNDFLRDENEVNNEYDKLIVTRKNISLQKDNIKTELDSLYGRKSNISVAQLKIREMICRHLHLNEAKLPFVGELIQVKDADKQEWEGALERVLHSFALSLLVPETHYAQVAAFVDEHNLKGRLVYFKVVPRTYGFVKNYSQDSLVTKIQIKPDDKLFYDFIKNELIEKFDYVCTRTQSEFLRESFAVTQNGQIKQRGTMHIKDDRYDIHDRSRYVLGWSNVEKIALLNGKVIELGEKIKSYDAQLKNLNRRKQNINNSKNAVNNVLRFNFEDIDVASSVNEIRALEKEKSELLTSSEVLNALKEQKKEYEIQIATLEQQKDAQVREKGGKEENLKRWEKELAFLNEVYDKASIDSKIYAILDEDYKKVIKKISEEYEQIDNIRQALNKIYQAKNEKLGADITKANALLIRLMTDFKHAYEVETHDFDVNAEAAPSYEGMLNRLIDDDLPRFESKFKEKLNQNTVVEIANLNAFLNREARSIKSRIEDINRSLYSIDYNPGRFIKILIGDHRDEEIAQFRRDLSRFTENTFNDGSDLESSEERFKQIKDLIDRLKGRERHADEDKKWREKVSDVRNWYIFAAEECWRETGESYDFYKDAGGKSGGQKEKLAYTILAASLAYQFNLGEENKRSFRFVIIDEAFGRGSDDSAKFGLNLFKKLDLQLLVVTPLQKISIIEPFISSVCLAAPVDIDGKRESYLTNFTIDEFKRLKAKRKQLQNNFDNSDSTLNAVTKDVEEDLNVKNSSFIFATEEKTEPKEKSFAKENGLSEKKETPVNNLASNEISVTQKQDEINSVSKEFKHIKSNEIGKSGLIDIENSDVFKLIKSVDKNDLKDEVARFTRYAQQRDAYFKNKKTDGIDDEEARADIALLKQILESTSGEK